MASQGSSLAKHSIIRFDLEEVALSGSLNNFRDPQLVLKTQNLSAPRVPFTGLRARKPVSRHLLLIHVKDKASELEMLDLASFLSPAEVEDPALLHVVESLSLERSLVFQYPKAATRARCTLKTKFKTHADLDTVIFELRALGIRIDKFLASHQIGVEATQVPRHVSATPRQIQVVGLVRDSRDLYTSSPPIPSPPTAEEWQSSNSANPAYRLISGRRSSHSLSQHSKIPVVLRPASPIGQPLRPATTMGIPGTLGEGIYRIRRVGSAPGIRAGVRKMSRLSESPGHRVYTVSKHFDKTLDRRDIVRSIPHRFSDSRTESLGSRPDEQPCLGQESGRLIDSNGTSTAVGSSSSGLAGETLLAREVPIRTSTSEEFCSNTSRLTLHPSTSALEPIPEDSARFTARHTSELQFHEGMHSKNTRRSTNMLEGSGESSSLQEGEISGTSQGTEGSHFYNEIMMTSHHQLRTVLLAHEGLIEASKVWGDLMTRGQLEADLANSLEEKDRILSKYAEEWATRLEKLSASCSRKIRDEGAAIYSHQM